MLCLIKDVNIFVNFNKTLNEFDNNSTDNNYDNINSENYIKKNLSNSWGLIISELINDGNTFFSITINPIDNCFDFKTWDERCGFEYDLLKHITKCFPTISFVWFIYEKNKIGKTHIHAILALKNFIDYNYILKNNLKDCLIKSVRVNGFIVNFKNIYGNDTSYGYNHSTEKYNEGWFVDLVGNGSNNYTFGYDVKVDSLLYFKDIKNWIIYMHKDIRSWNYSVGTSIYYTEEKLFNQIVNELTLLDKYDYYHGGIVTMFSMQYLRCFSIYLNNNSVLKSFFGIKITFNKIDQRTLINILQYYLILNDYYLYKQIVKLEDITCKKKIGDIYSNNYVISNYQFSRNFNLTTDDDYVKEMIQKNKITISNNFYEYKYYYEYWKHNQGIKTNRLFYWKK